jgi:hypothetical protein
MIAALSVQLRIRAQRRSIEHGRRKKGLSLRDSWSVVPYDIWEGISYV